MHCLQKINQINQNKTKTHERYKNFDTKHIADRRRSFGAEAEARRQSLNLSTLSFEPLLGTEIFHYSLHVH